MEIRPARAGVGALGKTVFYLRIQKIAKNGEGLSDLPSFEIAEACGKICRIIDHFDALRRRYFGQRQIFRQAEPAVGEIAF